MIRSVLIGGIGGSGKSTAVKTIIKSLTTKPPLKQSFGLVHMDVYKSIKLVVLGRNYDDDNDPYPGLDKLAHDVPPDALTFFKKMGRSPIYDGWSVLCEGYRLSSPGFIEGVKQIEGVEHTTIFIYPTEDILEENLSIRNKHPNLPEGYNKDAPSMVYAQQRHKTKLKNLTDVHDDIEKLEINERGDYLKLHHRVKELLHFPSV